MVRHLPGERVDGQQRCERCQLLLAYYHDEDLWFDSRSSLFFQPFVELVAHDGYLGQARAADDEVPECERQAPADAKAAGPEESRDSA